MTLMITQIHCEQTRVDVIFHEINVKTLAASGTIAIGTPTRADEMLGLRCDLRWNLAFVPQLSG